MVLREKVIVALMVLAVLWGAFMLIKGRGDRDKLTADEDKVFSVETVSKSLQNLQSNMPDQSIVAYLDKASAPSGANPFADASPSLSTTNTVAGTPEFIYSGHIRAGSREMAIINGQEYFEGETLSAGDYVVEQISDEKVLLRGKANGETKEVSLVEVVTK